MDNKTISSIFEDALFRQHQQESHHRFTLELGVFIALLFGLFMVGINELDYNTLFLDEAINVDIGEDLLKGIYTRNAIAFHFGSYLYPAISAVLNNIGGITLLRLASTLMMCLASVFVYLTTRKLFGREAGLFSMMLFSFSGVILNLGQLAVYDSLALPLLAASLLLLVTAAESEDRQKSLLLAASVCAILSTLSKYIGLIYLPALFLSAFVLFGLKETFVRQTLSRLFIYFIFPILLVLSFYAAVFWQELIQVFQGQGFSPAPRWLILDIIVENIGMVTLFALAGLVFLIFAVRYHRKQDTAFLNVSERSLLVWNSFRRSYRTLFLVLLVFVVASWMAAPLHHLITGNIRSLWKNCAYSLVFFSPLAGYCVATIIKSLRSRNTAANLIGILFLCASIIYFADRSLDSNWLFHGSWPNTQGITDYLKKSGLDENSRVLAEGMDIYEYSFDFGTNDRQVWNSFWYMEYGAKAGPEGAFMAIQDRALDFVIIDDYYLPGTRARLNPVLAEAGYVVGWQEEQKLRTGETILLQVFILGDESSK